MDSPATIELLLSIGRPPSERAYADVAVELKRDTQVHELSQRSRNTWDRSKGARLCRT